MYGRAIAYGFIRGLQAYEPCRRKEKDKARKQACLTIRGTKMLTVKELRENNVSRFSR